MKTDKQSKKAAKKAEKTQAKAEKSSKAEKAQAKSEKAEKPSKAEKAEKSEKAPKAKEPKAAKAQDEKKPRELKKGGAYYAMRHFLKNPELSIEDLIGLVEKEGSSISKSTLQVLLYDARLVLRVQAELG